MDLLTAQLVFFAIMTIAVCVWCHSLVRALQLGTTVDEEPEQWLASTAPETSMADRLVGSELVRGEQETVSRTIAKALLQHGTMFEITERTTDQVLATRTMSAHSDPNAIQCDGVGFALKRAGADTVEIVYCLDFGARRKRLRIAIFAILFGLGLPLLFGYWIGYLAVRHPQSNARHALAGFADASGLPRPLAAVHADTPL